MDIEYSSDIPDVPLPPGPIPSRFVKTDRSYLLLNSLIYITIGVLTNDLPLIILILEISKTTAVDEGTVAAEEDEVGTVVEPTVMNGLIVGAVVITTTGIETTDGDIVMTTMKGTVGVVAEDVGVDADVVDMVVVVVTVMTAGITTMAHPRPLRIILLLLFPKS